MNNVRFYSPDITGLEASGIAAVAESRWLANGPKVHEFERKIADISHCSRAVAYDSCTGAMEMALRTLGIGPGDEVITTPYTYSATAEVIRNVGAKIVFADICKDSFEMDPVQISKKINKNTKAIIPVDIGGKLCDYERLKKLLESHREDFAPNNDLQESIDRIAIVADAAHSFGAVQNGKAAGELADFTCFSFHVVKPITTGGEGGAIVWNDFDGVNNEEIERTLRLYGDHGQTSRNKSNGWEYDIALFGYNSIMTDVDAAMGLAQLDRLPDIWSRREAVTKVYDSLFNITDTATPLIKHIGEGYHSSMHLYPIHLNDRFRNESSRNRIFMMLKEAGVNCNVHYKPLPMMTAYKDIGFSMIDYPNAYSMFKNLLTIPYFSDLTQDEQECVVGHIRKAVNSI